MTDEHAFSGRAASPKDRISPGAGYQTVGFRATESSVLCHQTLLAIILLISAAKAQHRAESSVVLLFLRGGRGPWPISVRIAPPLPLPPFVRDDQRLAKTVVHRVAAVSNSRSILMHECVNWKKTALNWCNASPLSRSNRRTRPLGRKYNQYQGIGVVRMVRHDSSHRPDFVLV